MRITSNTGSSFSSDLRSEDRQLSALQKELRAASLALQALAGEEMSEKQKLAKAALLMAQMQMIQAQIEAILQKQSRAQPATQALSTPADRQDQTPSGTARTRLTPAGQGAFVNAYV